MLGGVHRVKVGQQYKAANGFSKVEISDLCKERVKGFSKISLISNAEDKFYFQGAETRQVLTVLQQKSKTGPFKAMQRQA